VEDESSRTIATMSAATRERYLRVTGKDGIGRAVSTTFDLYSD
jgi:hypothetical protein